MAVIQCHECKYGVSELAAWCQRCGYPVSKTHPLNIDNSKTMQALIEALNKQQEIYASTGASAEAFNFSNQPLMQPAALSEPKIKAQEPATQAAVNAASFDFDSNLSKPTAVPNDPAASEPTVKPQEQDAQAAASSASFDFDNKLPKPTVAPSDPTASEQAASVASSGVMVKCLECGHAVSENAAACTNCGCPMDGSTNSAGKPQSSKPADSGVFGGGWLSGSDASEGSKATGRTRKSAKPINIPKKAIIIPLIVVAVLALGYFAYNFFELDFFSGSADGNGVIASEQPETQTQSAEPSEPIPDRQTAVVADGQVLFDHDGIKITLRSLELDSRGRAELNVLIENDTEDSLTIQVRDVSINGIMFTSSVFSASVTAGNRRNDSVTFLSSGFERCGIEEIGIIELKFRVINNNDRDASFNTETIVIQTSIANQISQPTPVVRETLFEQDGISISLIGVEEDRSSINVVFFIENNTERNITIQARDESINGFMVSGIISTDITPGKMAIDTLTFSNRQLEENGIYSIEDVETIRFALRIIDRDNRDASFNTAAIEVIP